jgi:predicted kinase
LDLLPFSVGANAEHPPILMMSEQLLLIAGLPGCGKTTFVKELEEQGWLAFDDFKAAAHNDSAKFAHSKHYANLLAALRQGRRCVVADIDFCRSGAREEAERTLRQGLSNAHFVWCFFENDANACEANIQHRNREGLERDLAKMREYAAVYSIPVGIAVRPVHRAQT